MRSLSFFGHLLVSEEHPSATLHSPLVLEDMMSQRWRPQDPSSHDVLPRILNSDHSQKYHTPERCRLPRWYIVFRCPPTSCIMFCKLGDRTDLLGMGIKVMNSLHFNHIATKWHICPCALGTRGWSFSDIWQSTFAEELKLGGDHLCLKRVHYLIPLRKHSNRNGNLRFRLQISPSFSIEKGVADCHVACFQKMWP